MFTGNEPHEIPREDARALLAAWRRTAPKGHATGGYFGRQVIEKMLAQPGCVGIRFYYGRHDAGDATVVMVGVSATGDDLADGTVANKERPCPPYCPTGVSLGG